MAAEVRHLVQVQHLRLEPGDILAFVVNGNARCDEETMQAIREDLKAHVPDGVNVAILEGGYLAVLKESPEVEIP
jgi:hypothetical protein